MKQFGRQLQLELSSDSETLVINNLRVAFDIDKTINEKPNPATINIWNLNRTHINQLLSKEFKKTVLSVGYNELRVIYAGDIATSRIYRDGVDFIMSLECSDGFTDYTKARSAITLKSGATDSQIVAEVQKTMPNTQSGTIDFNNNRQLPRGKVLCGDSRAILTKIARNNNADWSIQNGELVFLPKDKVLNDEIIVLSQESGMVGMPEHTDDGLVVQCLLNPALQIGGLIQVKSILNHFDGEYKIVSLHHSGDNYEGDWLSKLTVVGGKFQKVEKKQSSDDKKKKSKNRATIGREREDEQL